MKLTVFIIREFIYECLKRLVVLVGIMMVAGLVTYLVNPNIQELIGSVEPAVSRSIDKTTQWNQFVAYITHNGFSVPIQMFAFALIPVPFLYWLQPMATALLPGILFGIILRYSFDTGGVVVLSALPHTLLELLAYSALLVVLANLNHWVRSKVFKRTGNKETFVNVLKSVIFAYMVFVVPLIICAAFFETYVADWISNILS